MPDAIQSTMSLLLKVFQSNWGIKHYVNNYKGTGNDHCRVKQDRSWKTWWIWIGKRELKRQWLYRKRLLAARIGRTGYVLSQQEAGLAGVRGTKLGIDYVIVWPSKYKALKLSLEFGFILRCNSCCFGVLSQRNRWIYYWLRELFWELS